MGVVQLLGMDGNASTVEAVDWILLFSFDSLARRKQVPWLYIFRPETVKWHPVSAEKQENWKVQTPPIVPHDRQHFQWLIVACSAIHST
jgi:hypothetical protein